VYFGSSTLPETEIQTRNSHIFPKGLTPAENVKFSGVISAEDNLCKPTKNIAPHVSARYETVNICFFFFSTICYLTIERISANRRGNHVTSYIVMSLWLLVFCCIWISTNLITPMRC